MVFQDGFIKQSSISFDYTVTLPELFSSAHSFPDRVRPVSAILSLNPQDCGGVEFLKHIEITMPHFVDLENEDDCKRLAFFKAVPKIVDGQEFLEFKDVSQDEIFSLFTNHHPNDETQSRMQYATLRTYHCCYFCVGEFSPENTNKARFCITRVRRKSSDSESFLYHHCIHYNLPTCIKVRIGEAFTDQVILLYQACIGKSIHPCIWCAFNL